MAAKKGGLGRGIDSLIVDKEEGLKSATNEPSTEIDINKVEPNKDQPRKVFNEDALEDLANNIKIHGIISPLIVQDRKDYYQIIAGERRWRAAKMAGLKTVPCIIRNFTEQEIDEISLIENVQRENLNAIEEALAYKKLITVYNMKQDEVAERVSKSRTAIANAIRLLNLSDKVQQMIMEDMISPGHARAILGLADQEMQYELAQKVFDEKLSVRDIEKEVKRLKTEPKDKTEVKAEKIDPKLVAIYNDLEEKLKQQLGTKVTINAKNNKAGKVEIDYYSADDLDRIIEILQQG